MGWEKRGNEFYYYRKVRKGGRVRSEYMGRGVYAQLCAKLIENGQLEREALRSEQQAEKEIDRQLETAGAAVSALTGAALHAAGYHRHKGQWRKCHDAKSITAAS